MCFVWYSWGLDWNLVITDHASTPIQLVASLEAVYVSFAMWRWVSASLRRGSSIRTMDKVGVNFNSQKLFASVYGCSTRRVMNIIHHSLNKNLMTKVALAFLSDLSKIHGHEIIHLHYSIIFFVPHQLYLIYIVGNSPNINLVLTGQVTGFRFKHQSEYSGIWHRLFKGNLQKKVHDR